MNNVKMYQAHKDPVRGLRWEPSGDNRRHFALIYVTIQQSSYCPTIVAGRLVVACDNKVDNDAATTDSQWRIVASSNTPGLVVCAMALHLQIVLLVHLHCDGYVASIARSLFYSVFL